MKKENESKSNSSYIGPTYRRLLIIVVPFLVILGYLTQIPTEEIAPSERFILPEHIYQNYNISITQLEPRFQYLLGLESNKLGLSYLICFEDKKTRIIYSDGEESTLLSVSLKCNEGVISSPVDRDSKCVEYHSDLSELNCQMDYYFPRNILKEIMPAIRLTWKPELDIFLDDSKIVHPQYFPRAKVNAQINLNSEQGIILVMIALIAVCGALMILLETYKWICTGKA